MWIGLEDRDSGSVAGFGRVHRRVSLPEEYNPAFRPVINEIGRRYKVDDVDVYSGGVWGQVMF